MYGDRKIQRANDIAIRNLARLMTLEGWCDPEDVVTPDEAVKAAVLWFRWEIIQERERRLEKQSQQNGEHLG